MMEMASLPDAAHDRSAELEQSSGHSNTAYVTDQGNSQGYYGQPSTGYDPHSTSYDPSGYSPSGAGGYPPSHPPSGYSGYPSSSAYPPSSAYPSSSAYPPSSAGYAPSGGYGSYGGSAEKPVLAPTVIVQEAPSSEPPSYIIIAIIAVCFNPLMGAIAMWFCLQSRHAARKGDYHLAAKRGRDTLWLSLGAIFFTLIILFSALIIYFTQGLTQRMDDTQLLSFTNDVEMNP